MTDVVLGLALGNFEPNARRAQKALADIGAQGTTSARQIAAATRQLPAQFTDIATQLAGGANPFLVLLQQGGQIKDSYGGIGPAARGLLSALNPVTLAVGGLAATVGTLGFAVLRGRGESEALRDSLLLTGNAAGLTSGRLQQVADGVVDMSRQTVGGAREIVTALAATGRTSSAVLDGQAKAIARLADLSGRSAKELATSFAGQLEGPAKFAAELNRAYNFLSVAQFRRIQQLEAEKRNAEAVNLTNQALAAALDKQRQNLGYLESAWDSVRRKASEAWNAMLGLGRTVGPAEALQRLRKEEAAILRASGGREPAEGNASALRLRSLRQGIADLQEVVRLEGRQAELASERAASNRQGIDALVRGDEGPKLGAIRTAREQYRNDFLVSEKAFYEEWEKLQRRELELARQDPLGEFLVERVLPDAARRGEQRLVAEAAVLQELVDTNARAGAELLADERERGLALIELDRSVAMRRLAQAELTAQAMAQAIEEVNERAALSQIALDRQISDKLQRGADAVGDRLTESISEGILDGFRRGGSFADVFLAELKAQFARTVLAPLIRPQVDAGNALLGDLLRGIGGLFTGGDLGLNPPAEYIATGEAIRGRRAGGGPVDPWGTYLVGERGPELLRMGARGGTVVPNGAAGGLAVSMPLTVHIDARSDQAQVAQLVAGAVADGQRRMYEDLRARRVLG